jgi:hypothetical protein
MHELLLLTQTSTVAGPPPVGEIGTLWTAIVEKNWPLAAGVGLSILIWILKKANVMSKLKLDTKWRTRLATLIFAVLGSVSMGLVQGSGWQDIVFSALNMAAGALLGWEYGGKALRDIFGDWADSTTEDEEEEGE